MLPYSHFFPFLSSSNSSIEASHAIFHRTNEVVTIAPVSPRATVLVNGQRIGDRVALMHLDRIVFGERRASLVAWHAICRTED